MTKPTPTTIDDEKPVFLVATKNDVDSFREEFKVKGKYIVPYYNMNDELAFLSVTVKDESGKKTVPYYFTKAGWIAGLPENSIDSRPLANIRDAKLNP